MMKEGVYIYLPYPAPDFVRPFFNPSLSFPLWSLYFMPVTYAVVVITYSPRPEIGWDFPRGKISLGTGSDTGPRSRSTTNRSGSAVT